ncbi:hypothetical protein BDR03DRAFT_947235 [Suillus americanus]|nr:hypothetical protein BDR03DRAFT_947235 [Suillus americanus]
MNPPESIDGRLINFQYRRPLKVNGNDQWIVKYKWDEPTQTFLVSITNKNTGAYLGWAGDFVVLSTSEYWWKPFTTEDQGYKLIAFRVPSDVNTDGFQTLQMQDDYSVNLHYQVGKPTDAQLWMGPVLDN